MQKDQREKQTINQPETAKYVQQIVPVYQNIPEIMALGPIPEDGDQVQELLAKSHPVTEEERQSPAIVRSRMEASHEDYYIYQASYYEIFQEADDLLRKPYVRCNCLNSYAGELFNTLLSGGRHVAGNSGEYSNKVMTILGPSGCGKSEFLTRFCAQYPEMIYHPEHEFIQIPIIFIRAPRNGSTKNFYLRILKEYSRITGIDYVKKFSNNNARAYEIGREVQKLFISYHTSLLIIDEVQRLGHRNFIDDFHSFFTDFIQTNNVSMIWAGTEDTMELLNKCTHLTRRAETAGEYHLEYLTYWDEKDVEMEEDSIQRMTKENDNNIWQEYVQTSMDHLLITPERIELNPEISQTLYNLSNGCLAAIKTILSRASKMINLQINDLEKNGEYVEFEIDSDFLRLVSDERTYSLVKMLGKNNEVREIVKPVETGKQIRTKNSKKYELTKQLLQTAKDMDYDRDFYLSDLKRHCKVYLDNVDQNQRTRDLQRGFLDYLDKVIAHRAA